MKCFQNFYFAIITKRKLPKLYFFPSYRKFHRKIYSTEEIKKKILGPRKSHVTHKNGYLWPYLWWKWEIILRNKLLCVFWVKTPLENHYKRVIQGRAKVKNMHEHTNVKLRLYFNLSCKFLVRVCADGSFISCFG